MKQLHFIASIMVLPFVLTTCSTDAKDKKKTATTMQGKRTMTRTKTSSGLEYSVLREGAGLLPVRGKQVTVHYTGWLNDNGEPGTKFDSSVDRDRPFTFIIGVGQVIKGWDEGVLSMKVGEKRRLFIPASLAYGAYSPSRSIPAHADLIFDVELINLP